MNIFKTSECPIESAKALSDIHVNKMLLESLQLLSTAHVVVDGVQVAYKKTHVNHPCAIWCRESKANYMWLFQHAKALSEEYTFRTGKVHASSRHLNALSIIPAGVMEENATTFKRAMPDSYSRLDTTQAYRVYLNHKHKEWQAREQRPILAKWTKRNKPEWA